MSPAVIITWLGWICFAGAGVALIVYLVHFAGRQGWKRPWNAAGLFFTSIALSQMPFASIAAAAARMGSSNSAVARSGSVAESRLSTSCTAWFRREWISSGFGSGRAIVTHGAGALASFFSSENDTVS